MKQNDRGMVRYAPYQSLVEQSLYLAKMRQNRAKTEKKSLFCDEMEEINEILVHYQGEPVLLVYWRDGYERQEQGTIQKIDPYRQALCINDTWVAFRCIVSLIRK